VRFFLPVLWSLWGFFLWLRKRFLCLVLVTFNHEYGDFSILLRIVVIGSSLHSIQIDISCHYGELLNTSEDRCCSLSFKKFWFLERYPIGLAYHLFLILEVADISQKTIFSCFRAKDISVWNMLKETNLQWYWIAQDWFRKKWEQLSPCSSRTTVTWYWFQIHI
jgi:hypothetical protein